MHIDLFPSGLVDDFLAEYATIRLSRTGIARYALVITTDTPITIMIWTSRKGRIESSLWQQAVPTWVMIRFNDNGDLEELESIGCTVHFEHLDRDAYALVLSRSNEDWGVILRTSGYLKTRIEQE
jgi:hypothetical protein